MSDDKNIGKRVRIPGQQDFLGVIAQYNGKSPNPYGIQFDNAREGVLYWVKLGWIVYVDDKTPAQQIAELKTALTNVLKGLDPIQERMDLDIFECTFCGAIPIERGDVDSIRHTDDCEWVNGWKVLNKSNGE